MSYYFSKACQLISFSPAAPDTPTDVYPINSIPTSTSSSSFHYNGRYGHDRYSLHPDTVVGVETYKKYAVLTYDDALNRGIGEKGESVKGRGFCLLALVDDLRSKSVVSPKFGQKSRKFLDNDELTEELLYLRNLIHNLNTVLKLWKVDPVRDHVKYSQAVDELEASKEKEPLELYIRNFLRWFQSTELSEQDEILENSEEESLPATPELGALNSDKSWADMTTSEYKKEETELLDDDMDSWETVYADEAEPEAKVDSIPLPPTPNPNPTPSNPTPSDPTPSALPAIIFTNTRAPRFLFSPRPPLETPKQPPTLPTGEIPLPLPLKDTPGLTAPKIPNSHPHQGTPVSVMTPKWSTSSSLEPPAPAIFDISGNMQAGEKRGYDTAFAESGSDDEAGGCDEQLGSFWGEGAEERVEVL